MRVRALVLSSLVVLCALGAAAYASIGGGKPDAGEVVASSLRAVARERDDLKVHYAVSARVDATPSAQATAQTRKLLSAPVSVSASGGLSEQAVTLAGTVGLMGGSYRAEARVGRSETYVNLLGTWYGDRTKGLGTAKDEAEDRAGSKASAEAAEKALRWIHDHADEVLDATVTAGPDIDGETWQAKGRCKAGAIVALAERNGETVSAEDRKGVETFCRLAELTYVVGADDRLPRQLRIAVDLDRQTLTRLAAAGDGASARELDALRLVLDVRLTRWGKDVEYTAPADAKPMEDIGTALLGLAFTAMS